MTSEQLEERQLVLCTVDKIMGTTVFVKIEGYNNEEGIITTSEISPGRIRNIRDFVVPGKKIVCQILRIEGNRIQLSLRRVKPSARKELLEKIDKERSYIAILKTVLGSEKSELIKEKIGEDYTILDFFDKVKQEPKILEEYFKGDEAEKINKILDSKKEKPKEIKQLFKISNKSEKGATIVKNIIQESCKGTKCSVNYIAAGRYAMTQKGETFKGLKSEMTQAMQKIEEFAKKNRCDFSIEKS
jgi:translation initiation factor 2 alpha subunit (eIF-2alpha)